MSKTPRILTINGGSSSIKFAVFAVQSSAERVLAGQVDRLGQANAKIEASDFEKDQALSAPVSGSDYTQVAQFLAEWLETWNEGESFEAIGHRVVHGGVKVNEHQVVSPRLMEELRLTVPLDLAHLPGEIALIEAFSERFPGVLHVACLDTAFHRDLPRVAQILPIPRQYTAAGLRRLGFHGLSYAYLLGELRRVAGKEADGRVIMAHLGSGASMTALREGKPLDTSMAFTPTAGLMMGTRPGDLDPGLLAHLLRTENFTLEELDDFLTRRCGLKGVSETSSDMRELIQRRDSDIRAREAVELFCRQAKKGIGAYTAVLEGLDTLVFSGGIGEHSPEIREEICRGLEYLGMELDTGLNSASAGVVSTPHSGVTVRVIATDEELMVANIVNEILRKRNS